MEFIKLKKEEDLKVVKSLVDYKEYFESDDIMWDRSVKCIANNGDLLGFALIKPNSLFDFFGGEIPPEIGVPDNKKWWVKEDLESLRDKHYEVLFYVNETGDLVDDIIFQHDLAQEIKKCPNSKDLFGVLWTRVRPKYMTDYILYNNLIFMEIPILD